MKKLMIAMSTLALAAPLLMSAPAQAQSSQQNKMTTCNKDAGDKKGDERKAFMKDCLSNKPTPVQNAQQSKMTTCNKEAAGKKGDERKAFMSSCLKKEK